MSDLPALSKLAAALDPQDREGVKQFRRIGEFATVSLDPSHRSRLLDRLFTGIAMLELASITGDAAFRFRNELVAAAKAIDQAVIDADRPPSAHAPGRYG